MQAEPGFPQALSTSLTESLSQSSFDFSALTEGVKGQRSEVPFCLCSYFLLGYLKNKTRYALGHASSLPPLRATVLLSL